MSTDETTDTTDATDTTESSADRKPTPQAETTETTAESACGASQTQASSESTTASDSTSQCGGSTGASGSTTSSSSSCGATATDEDDTSENVGATIDDFEADPGRLLAVGLGPGQPEGMTARARSALGSAEHIVGYTTYIDLLPDEITEGADDIYDTPMCGEVSRTEEAIDRALAGNDVAIVGSGDPNVYALAGLPWSRKRRENFETCCEILLEHRDPDTPVGVVHGAGRDDEQSKIIELGELESLGETDLIDMTTTIIVGNEETYVWDGRMVTPRGYETKYDY